MLVFGLVTGGFWLWIGFAILAVTLLYWGREALRDYDHIPSASTALVTTGGTGLATGGPLPPGPLPAPAGSPPAGVHMPGPSFKPLLVAMSMTLLVAGLVVGGWALIFGFIALVGHARSSGSATRATSTSSPSARTGPATSRTGRARAGPRRRSRSSRCCSRAASS